jgi:hypothetical protein
MAKQRIDYLKVDRLDIQETLVAGGTNIDIATLGSSSDEKSKVSSNDTTPGFLNGKLVAGTNVTLTENNNGGDETLTISAAAAPVTSVNGLTGPVTLTAASVGAAATVHTHAASDVTSGVFATARLASSGTASASTYLRGDQTWATIAGGGGTTGFTPTQNVAAPNATINASRLLVDVATSSGDAVLQPKGFGAVMAQLPDSTDVGGNKRGSYAVDWQMHRATAAQVASGDYSVVAGGQSNTASASHSVIIGGSNNLVSGTNSIAGGNACSISASSCIGLGANITLSGSFSTALGSSLSSSGSGQSTLIGFNTSGTMIARSMLIANNSSCTFGGWSTIVGGEFHNTGSGSYTTIVGGFSQYIDNNSYATIIGGRSHQSFGDYSTVLGGRSNVATGIYSTAQGYQSDAFYEGSRVLASGMFATVGDAQLIEMVMRRQTADATTLELSASGSSADNTNTLAVPTDTAISFDILVTARNTTTNGESAGWTIRGVITNDAGTVSFAGSPTVTSIGSNAGAATWVVAVNADNTNDRLNVRVTGEVGKTIKWLAHVRATHLTA